jgi:hypothetical protein
MSEKKLVIDQLKLAYEGPMDVKGLFRMIDSFFYEKGYNKWEVKNAEQALSSGKTIEIEIEPWKFTTDYFCNIIKIRMNFTDLKDIEVEKEGRKVKVQNGKVMMIIDGYFLSDYENKWEKKAWMMFIRTIYDKYIFAKQFAYFERWLVNDVYDVHSRIQSYLNLYRYDRRVP